MAKHCEKHPHIEITPIEGDEDGFCPLCDYLWQEKLDMYKESGTLFQGDKEREDE